MTPAPLSPCASASLLGLGRFLGRLSIELKEATLVYDKGNNSRKNLAAVDQAEIGYAASLAPGHFKDLQASPLSQALRLFRNLVSPHPPFVHTVGKSQKPCK